MKMIRKLFNGEYSVFTWIIPTVWLGTIFMILFIEFKNPLFLIIGFVLFLAFGILLAINVNIDFNKLTNEDLYDNDD